MKPAFEFEVASTNHTLQYLPAHLQRIVKSADMTERAFVFLVPVSITLPSEHIDWQVLSVEVFGMYMSLATSAAVQLWSPTNTRATQPTSTPLITTNPSEAGSRACDSSTLGGWEVKSSLSHVSVC